MKQPAIQSAIVDHREPLWMHRLQLDGATVVVSQLQCGDVWLAAADGKLLIIERKTVTDLLASIADGRLFEQAAAMVAMSPWSYIVVQGTLESARDGRTLAAGMVTNWQWAAVQGALQTAQEMGVAVIYLSGDDADFAAFLCRLAARDRSAVRAGAPRKVEMLLPGMAALMALPGIGGDRAKLLLDTWSSAAWALTWLTDPHADGEVPGIGKATRDSIRAALGVPDNSRLELVALEN